MKTLKIILLLIIVNSRTYAIDDLTDKSWTEAFKIVHAKVEMYYPFIEYKRINLDSLYKVTLAAVQKAERNNNDTAYFLAIKRYAMAFHDNHFFARQKGFHIFSEELSGHYGIEITELDNGDMVVSQIREGTTSLPEQVKVGCKIVSWNNKPIKEAANQAPLLPSDEIEASLQNIFLAKCRFLMYAPVGNKVRFSIVDMKGKTEMITLIANPSKKLKPAKSYPKNTLWKRVMKSPVSFDVFDDDSIGYFQVSNFMPSLVDFFLPSTFREKLWILERLKIKSLIIDLRGNYGGMDNWAKKMAGHFVTEKKHYQYISKYNEAGGKFEIDSSLTAVVEPRKPYFDKQVVVLVDNHTVSTGEGLPMVLQGLANVKIIGQYNTAGAFAIGFSDFIFKMPANIVFGFFEGRSLDKNGNIQLDTDYRGIGGVSPDIKIPVTQESIKTQYVENKDYVLQYAIDYLSTK